MRSASRPWRWWLGSSALVLCGCPSPQASPDAASAPDAAEAADASPGQDGGVTTVRALGNLARLGSTLTVTLLPDWRACTIGTVDPVCDDTGLIGEYEVTIPAATELALRAFDPSDATAIPWIRPIRSGATDVHAGALLMPERAFSETLLGGYRDTVAYAVVYVERPIEGMPLELRGRGVPGYVITSSAGTVRYVDADVGAIDTAATSTTTSGLVVISDIPAGAWSESAPLTDLVEVTVTAPPGESLCGRPGPGLWVRTEDTSSFTAEGPVFAGHVTYAAFLTCPPL